MRSSLSQQACHSCGVVGPSHGSDTECVAALRVRVYRLQAVVDSVVQQFPLCAPSQPADPSRVARGVKRLALSHRDR